MSEAQAKDEVGQQEALILGIIRETRILVSSLEIIESVLEDNPINFKPLLKLAKDGFKELLSSGRIEDKKATQILEDLDDLEEEINDFEKSIGALRPIHFGM